jgi:hypothetical protein
MAVTDKLVPFTPVGYPALEDGAKLWAVDNYDGASNSVKVIIETMRALETATSPVGHTHVIADVTGLQTALDSKASNSEDYLVKTASTPLTAERVVTDTATVAWDWATGGQAKANVPDNSISYAKIQDISATARVLGRKTASAGDTEEVTLSELLDFIGGAARGDILYRGASAWARLPAGTSGNFLKTLGAGADPAWDTVSSGGMTLITSASFPAATTWSFTNLGGYKLLLVCLRGVAQSSGSSQVLQCALSGNNGSSYGSVKQPGGASSFISGGTVCGAFLITRCDQTNNQYVGPQGMFIPTLSNQVDSSSRGPIDAFQLSYNSGASFSAGDIDVFGFK